MENSKNQRKNIRILQYKCPECKLDRKEDREDKYLWIIELDTFDGGWFDHHLSDALEMLKSVGNPVSFSVFSLLDVWQK